MRNPSGPGHRPSAVAAPMRDPLVPLDLGGWVRRSFQVFRQSFRGLATLALGPALLGALYWITLDAVRPDPADTRRRLAAAAGVTGQVDPWTELRIEAPPVLPVMVGFGVVIVLVTAIAYGGAYHLALREANGQPARIADTLRAAAPRTPRFIGWAVLSTVVTTLVGMLLLLPGLVTGSPWLSMIGPVIAFAVLIGVGTTVFPTLLGVVFVEGAGLRRCVQLVKARFWATLGRTVLTVLAYLVYSLVAMAVVRLLLWPFGGPRAVGRLGAVVVHLLDAAVSVPLTVFLIAVTLVSYAELRFREDSSTTTRTLVAELPG